MNEVAKLSFGSFPSSHGTIFKVWAPTATSVEIHVYNQDESKSNGRKGVKAIYTLMKDYLGIFTETRAEVKAGDLYKIKVDDNEPFPDPASHFQPEGVHGPSQVVDLTSFQWTDQEWMRYSQPNLFKKPISIYEIHVGTFTKEGTFRSIIPKLSHLKELGVTAYQLMPLADFPGKRNWGYDGVSLYAPPRCYGTPQDLMELINESHKLGIAVFLDVVYNHLGPDGNYLSCFSPYYFTERYGQTPWGQSVNIDSKMERAEGTNHTSVVRKFFIENGVYWVDYFHFDGLRLDATHEFRDSNEISNHFLREFHEAVNKNRSVIVVAEDSRNLNSVIDPQGYDLEGVWSDDFQHQVRVALLNNDIDYTDFSGKMEDIAETINRGWFYSGQKSEYHKTNRGSNPDNITDMKKFFFFLQNHDQVGNRALGDRLHHQISLEAYKVGSSLTLFCPETPILFMGEEWASLSPFCFFTDHNEELGRLVNYGRKKELRNFNEFNYDHIIAAVPSPQDVLTFEKSKLDWEILSKKNHNNMFRFFKTMLSLRNTDPVMQNCERGSTYSFKLTNDTLVVIRKDKATRLVGIFHFRDTIETISLRSTNNVDININTLKLMFCSTDQEFASDKVKVVEISDDGCDWIKFNGYGAVFFRGNSSVAA